MWLINTISYELEMFTGSKNIPPYAILSHTWGNDKDEVTFKEMVPGVESSPTAAKEGFMKIKMACTLARIEYNLDYAWVDTCCIDKSSSAELSEAINSMFKWYQQADVCFAYLADLTPGCRDIWSCRWFSRGWTLQELIAPERMAFFDASWTCFGDKQSLTKDLAKVSGISEDVLRGRRSLSDVPIAVRMSWASIRHTTREEDQAYCLLGLFDVNMPMLYGEGTRAFFRLQQEIIKESADMSIFAWLTSNIKASPYSGLLAESPADFEEVGSLVIFENSGYIVNDFSTTNRGIKLRAPMVYSSDNGYHFLPIFHRFPSDSLQLDTSDNLGLLYSTGILLRQVGPDLFVRAFPRSLHPLVPVNVGIDSIRSVQVVKTLSMKEAASINSRVVCIREPVDLISSSIFQVSEVEPAGCWDLSEQKLYAGHTGFFLGYIKFKSDQNGVLLPFVLICRFDSSRLNDPWRFAVVGDTEWTNLKPHYQERYDFYSSSFPRVQRQIILTLPKEHAQSIGKRVVLSRLPGDASLPEYQSIIIHLE
ncbi:hypothetical protein IFR05_003357 [Cadophora sp. M221]|nr:hypothetical protein IFR05_003357 [Cadophora sp. M221]